MSPDKNYIRCLCLKGYEWPDQMIYFSETIGVIHNIIDLDKLHTILKCFDRSDFVAVAFLSKEYLNVGKLWLQSLENKSIKQYIIIAADIETEIFVKQLNVSCCRLDLSGVNYDTSFRSRTGFTFKGLEIIAAKFPIANLIVEKGFDVLLTDIDAIFLHPLTMQHFRNFDVLFQRVVYFPEPIVKEWGFAACSGFIYFRSNTRVKILLDKIIDVQKQTCDDQVALNVALWESEIKWTNKIVWNISVANIEERKNIFSEWAGTNLDGIGGNSSLTVRALSPEIFWRNDCVTLDLSKAILLHPNSGKSENEKIAVFRKYNQKIKSK